MIEAAKRWRGLAVLALLTTTAAACGAGEQPGPARSPGTRPSTATPASPPAGVAFERGVVSIETGGGDVQLDVEVARTEETRRLGLMGRSELPRDAGMVFLFEDEAERSFWMKDTLIPLSIAFFDADGRIVSMLEMTPCSADPCRIYRSGKPAVGAIEANAGFFAERGVSLGDRVRVRAD